MAPSTPKLPAAKGVGGRSSTDPPSSKRGGGKSKSAKKAGGSELEPVREDAGAPSSPLLHCAVSPLMEPAGSKGLKLRAEFDLTSAEAGELPPGTACHVLETRPTADGALRMAVVPEGELVAIGWLTGVTKDGKKNLTDLGRPVCEVTAAKPLAAREAFELTSGKAGELAVGAFFHVLEVRETADGAQRVAYAAEGTETVQGWVTLITKDGTENLRLCKGRRAAAPASPTGGAATSPGPGSTGKKGAAGGGRAAGLRRRGQAPARRAARRDDRRLQGMCMACSNLHRMHAHARTRASG